MRKKLSILMILILVLAQLCACGKTQADPAPAAGSESAVPAAGTDEPAADAQALEPEPADPHVPDRVLVSKHYSAEIYEMVIRQYRCSIESREYAVSDGVTARAFRATGVGGPSKFLDHTVQEGGTLHYFDASSGKWVETPLAEGKYASPVVVLELNSGASYFLALPRTFILHENDTKEYLPEMDGTLYVTKTPDGFHLTVNGYGLAEGRVTECLILSVVEQQDSYGYEISQTVKLVAAIKESTLYPILRKLETGGYLTTYSEEFQGRKRKYYSITEEGRRQLAYLRKEWREYRNTVDDIVEGRVKK